MLVYTDWFERIPIATKNAIRKYVLAYNITLTVSKQL
jgi:hypothetical protein